MYIEINQMKYFYKDCANQIQCNVLASNNKNTSICCDRDLCNSEVNPDPTTTTRATRRTTAIPTTNIGIKSLGLRKNKAPSIKSNQYILSLTALSILLNLVLFRIH